MHIPKVLPWGLETEELFGGGTVAIEPDDWDSAVVRKSATETQQLNDSRLALGSNHGAAVVGGDVYTWGKAQHGRLGHGGIVEEQESHTWCRVETLHIHSIRIAGVACGSSHMFAFGDDGLYAWGDGSNGRLGLGDEQSRNIPTEVRGVGP